MIAMIIENGSLYIFILICFRLDGLEVGVDDGVLIFCFVFS